MKKFQSLTSRKPFAALACFIFLIVPAQISLAQPAPVSLHSFFYTGNPGDVLPANGTYYRYAPPQEAQAVNYSGKGIVVASEHDYEVYGDVILFENTEPPGAAPHWRGIDSGVGDYKIVTAQQGATPMADNGDEALGRGSYKVLFKMEAFLTTTTGDQGAQTDPVGSASTYFFVSSGNQ